MTQKAIRFEIPEEDHRRVKAAAALAGEQIKEYAHAALMDRVAKDEVARLAPKREEVSDDNHAAS